MVVAGRMGVAWCGSDGGERGGSVAVRVSDADRKGNGDGGESGR